jgi:hypothetical protein
MTKFLNNCVSTQLVILSRADGEGPHKLPATSLSKPSLAWIVRSLALLGMTK